MLASFVNGRAFPVLLGAARTDRAFNLVTDDPLNAISDCFLLPQLVAHASEAASAEGERDVAVFRLAGDIAANPIRRLESRAVPLVIEFHFGHYETIVPAAINIDLDRIGFP